MIEFSFQNYKKPCIIFGVGFFIFFTVINYSLVVFSQELASPAKDADIAESAILRINSVVQNIYDEAMAAKVNVKELANFDEKCLVKNKDGFLTITYEIQMPVVGGKTTLYAVKIDVEPITAKTYTTQDGYFNYLMPFLDLQFSGFIIKHPLRRQFDFEAVLKKYAQELADYQQQFMPLRLFVVPLKESFRVGEPIRFRAVLVNTSKENILVKGLGQDSLFVTINGSVWGTKQGEAQTFSAKENMRQQRQKASEVRNTVPDDRLKQESWQGVEVTKSLGTPTQIGDKFILRKDEVLAVEFVGDSYKRPQDIEIRSTYQLSMKGLNPTAQVMIKIIP